MMVLRLLLIGLLLSLGAGCSTVTDRGAWGASADWPSGERVVRSAGKALRSPGTWGPLVGAVVFGATNLDEEVADWATRETPLFGSDAESISDTLKYVNAGAYLATALLAPSDSARSRARGLAVGFSTLAVERLSVGALKELTGRERPDGSDDLSLPSGHTSLAAVTATMAADNLAYIDMPTWARLSSRIGVYSVAAGTGWARVEAQQHFPSDVLAGYAVGHFVARFMHEAFLANENAGTGARLEVSPLPAGAYLSLTLPLR